jgi:hypothetical protein
VLNEASAVRQVLEWLSLVVPLLSIVTAFLFWFGWTYTSTRTAYFGIDHSSLGYSPTEYLLRSADGVFLPLAMVLLTALVALAAHTVLAPLIGSVRHRRKVRAAAWTLAGVGLVATIAGVVGMFVPLSNDPSHYLLTPFLQGGGIALGSYAAYILRRKPGNRDRQTLRRRRMTERALFGVAVLLVMMNFFWGATMYAAALGTGRSESLLITNRPSVTIFSKQSLGLSGSVRKDPVEDPDSLYKYRYTQLRLLIQSNDKYFLVTEGWTPLEGSTIVLDDSPDIRLELSPGGR